MKSPKNTTLYSRFALITSVTLVVGYLVVYAWYTIPDVNTGDILTKDLVNHILSNVTDLNTRVSNFSFSAGNVGIGATTTTLGSQSSVKLILNGTAGAKNWQMDVGALTTGHLNFTPSTVNGGTTFTTPAMVIGDTGNVGINTINPISIGGFGKSLHIAANAGPTIVLQDPDTTPGYRVGYLSFIDGVLTYGRAADDGSTVSPRFTINGSNQFIINTLAATYTNGSAFVCVNNSGQLYASESTCP